MPIKFALIYITLNEQQKYVLHSDIPVHVCLPGPLWNKEFALVFT